MPSKGVECYSYIAVPDCEIQFDVPGNSVVRNEVRVFYNDHLEVDKANINGIFDFTGDFSFTVTQNGGEITSQNMHVNSLTGNLGAGTLKTVESQTSIVSNNVTVSFGFYDAGPGVAGLPSSHQCYVTVAPNYSGWMGEVAPTGSPQASQPFSKFFLPAAHDIGMNSMQNADALLASSALAEVLVSINPTFGKVASTLTHGTVKLLAPNIIRGLAITQKDTQSTILGLGARYFEFRPAYLYDTIRVDHPIPDKLYFHHSAIPGMPYEQFLSDAVAFLLANPTEIIVVQLRWDGIPTECARPTDEDQASHLNAALAASNGTIVAGSLNDMLSLTIAELRDQNKRLIIFVNSASYSTYTDEGNATLDGDSIVAEFEALKQNPSLAAGKPFTNLQCQATATNLPEPVAYSVVAADADSSILLATKPICDSKTLPWVAANGDALLTDELVVLMNDFFDGATADVAIQQSLKRLA